jgi:hypothetical protein
MLQSGLCILLTEQVGAQRGGGASSKAQNYRSQSKDFYPDTPLESTTLDTFV